MILINCGEIFTLFHWERCVRLSYEDGGCGRIEDFDA
jgi:hypothetical protein